MKVPCDLVFSLGDDISNRIFAKIDKRVNNLILDNVAANRFASNIHRNLFESLRIKLNNPG